MNTRPYRSRRVTAALGIMLALRLLLGADVWECSLDAGSGRLDCRAYENEERGGLV